jgi:hypothetical protein
MSVWDAIANLSALDWFVVALTVVVSLLGMLLPKLGNLLGRLFLGEDPLLERWTHARADRRAAALARKQAQRTEKAARVAARLGAKSGNDTPGA